MSDEPSNPNQVQGGGRVNWSNYVPGGDDWERDYAEMQKVFKEAGAENSEIAVYRRAKKAAKFKYVDTISIEGFTIQGIADEYGGGQYKFTTKLGGQVGPVFYVEIDERILGLLDKQQAAQPASPAYDAVNMLRTVKEVLGDSQGHDNNDLLKSLLESQEKSRASQGSMFLGLITAMAPIVAAIISRPVPQSSNDKLLELLLPTLMNKPNTDMAASLEFVKGLKALASDKPEKDDHGMLEKIMTMAATTLPALVGAMSPQLTRQVGPPQGQITDQPPMPNQPPAEPDISKLVPRVYAAMLTKAAQTNASVEPWVEIIEQMTDDAQWDGLQDLLLRADWLAIISAQLPELAPFPEWLGKLRDALLADTEEDDDLTPPQPEAKPKTS